MKTFGENESSIRKAFRVLDKDKNGYVTVKEMKDIMMKMGEQLTEKEVREMIDEADTNGDGRIDMDEFVDMMMSV